MKVDEIAWSDNKTLLDVLQHNVKLLQLYLVTAAWSGNEIAMFRALLIKLGSAKDRSDAK